MTELGEVVECFAEEDPLDIRRATEMVVVNGRRRDGAYSPVPDIVGSSWPVQGVKLTRNTEGKRSFEFRDVFTTPNSARLKVADDVEDEPGDLLVVEGRTYEIVEAHPWVRGAFGHYIAERIKRPDGV